MHCIALTLWTLLLPATPVVVSHPVPYAVSVVRAFLFYPDTCKFGEQNLLNDPHVALWNTNLGGGSAGKPSNATLVLVEVTGPKVFRARGTPRYSARAAASARSAVVLARRVVRRRVAGRHVSAPRPGHGM